MTEIDCIDAEHDVLVDLPGVYEESFPSVAAFVAKMGGSLEDAKDIFHDAMVIFFEKVHR
jgi:hypothetical protein